MSKYINIDKENNVTSNNLRTKPNNNNENIRIANKENITRPQSTSSRRIPLGGKNQNINKISLSRSNSALNTKTPIQQKDAFQPPPLNKSNSSLGFTSIKEAAVIQNIPLHQPKPKHSNKRVLVQSIDDLSYLNAKRQKLLTTNDTDSLIKHDIRPKSAIESISSTLTNYTDSLDVRHVPDTPNEYFNVDPIKRRTEINALVNKHWQDEIESIPEKPKSSNGLSSFQTDELKYFSTPNISDEYSMLKNNSIGTTNASLNLSFGDEEDHDEDEQVGDIPIQEYEGEIVGLSKEDLNNLLD